jgi:predicted HAD superfamily Cof-like phosphohydrolase
MKNLLADVAAFHAKFGVMTHETPGHLTQRKLNERVECMMEELREFMDACDAQDLAEQGDALVDLIYFAVGTALMLGLPLDQMWTEVQRANMEKVAGRTHRQHEVDVTKPIGWRPPDHHAILQAAGYKQQDWLNPGNHRDDK